MSCVDGVLASAGDVQTYEEACDEECCVGPGVYDGFTIRVCRDSASCSGEGACSDVSIYDVFLGCEGTEAPYYAGNKGKGDGQVAYSEAVKYGREIPGGSWMNWRRGWWTASSWASGWTAARGFPRDMPRDLRTDQLRGDEHTRGANERRRVEE